MARLLRRGDKGQAMVEFALVAPIFFAVLFGIIASGWLFFESEAVNSAAQSGAREALVENFSSGTTICEDPQGGTVAIQAAAQHAASVVPVDANQLCGSVATGTCPNNSSDTCQELTQAPSAGTAEIKVYAEPTFAAANFYVVQVSYLAHPLAPFFQSTINLTSQSILNSQGGDGQ